MFKFFFPPLTLVHVRMSALEETRRNDTFHPVDDFLYVLCPWLRYCNTMCTWKHMKCIIGKSVFFLYAKIRLVLNIFIETGNLKTAREANHRTEGTGMKLWELWCAAFAWTMTKTVVPGILKKSCSEHDFWIIGFWKFQAANPRLQLWKGVGGGDYQRYSTFPEALLIKQCWQI